ncbi:UDP-D-glucose epimerase 3 [Hordeum vulgare]|nr:UDP-D-glucose epimerase 3 [Hordeum vulgare]
MDPLLPVDHLLNMYDRIELYLKKMLRNYQHANSEWRTILKCYFNPIGIYHRAATMGRTPSASPTTCSPTSNNGRRPPP